MIIRQKDIDALRDKLKVGDKVKYQTEIIDDSPGRVQKQDNEATVTEKLPHMVIVEYMARRGRNMEPVRTAITYREIFFQRRGLIY